MSIVFVDYKANIDLNSINSIEFRDLTGKISENVANESKMGFLERFFEAAFFTAGAQGSQRCRSEFEFHLKVPCETQRS